ncbi:helix-turn-helix transcriptional regulator [Cryptosporangium aurantiacum]|uniref:Helix-turn-helix domain-containing protein n=1 Tax=Cryptosporangium aurantiacum TaxID=134849 RepID=A0A1M7R3G1_9ACTN|nr:helix-turn-helix transcriptional regulator [Cryptosporangium aurantiacum]SHN39500.1 Helix-turn-helix domain-containing protein [Cryptosporangium aurantiacum]
MARDTNLNELGEFLRARRAEVSPADAGLPDGGKGRRVAGLRREEVAVLSAISTDYYTRIEQGRIQASEPVLAEIARVLRLDEDQREYLYELAGKQTRRPRRLTRQRVDPQLQRLLDDLPTTPAFVIGRRTDILAWNAMGAALITDFGKIPEKHRTFIRLLFTDPAMRRLYADWEGITRLAIAQLRMHSVHHPDDPRLAALVGELSVADPQFRQWWASHQVAARGTGVKHLHHPVVGDLTLDWNTLTCATDPDQQIIVWTAEAGSPSHDGLRLLASWAADAARATAEHTGSGASPSAGIS